MERTNLVLLIISTTAIITGLLLYIPPLTRFFHFQSLSMPQLAISIAVGFLSVIWYDVVKLFQRKSLRTALS